MLCSDQIHTTSSIPNSEKIFNTCNCRPGLIFKFQSTPIEHSHSLKPSGTHETLVSLGAVYVKPKHSYACLVGLFPGRSQTSFRLPYLLLRRSHRFVVPTLKTAPGPWTMLTQDAGRFLVHGSLDGVAIYAEFSAAEGVARAQASSVPTSTTTEQPYERALLRHRSLR